MPQNIRTPDGRQIIKLSRLGPGNAAGDWPFISGTTLAEAGHGDSLTIQRTTHCG
jgi:hypothetical protein